MENVFDTLQARGLVAQATDADAIRELLGKEKVTFENANEEDEIGIVRGLAWTSVGGDTLQIEVDVAWHTVVCTFNDSLRRHIVLHNRHGIQRVQVERHDPFMLSNLRIFHIPARILGTMLVSRRWNRDMFLA